jgi:hypothetical protein
MRIKIVQLMAATGMVALGACGFTGNLRFNSGYAELGSPGFRDTDRDFGLSLGPLPIRLARAFMADDPEISGILRSLKGVRVYTYEVNGDAERVHARMAVTRARLIEQGWQSVVAVREDGGLVSALVRLDEPDLMRGLVVLVQDDEDVVLVNLIGAIEPETFALVMDEIGIEMPTMAVALPGECPEAAETQESLLASVTDGSAEVARELEIPSAFLEDQRSGCMPPRGAPGDGGPFTLSLR